MSEQRRTELVRSLRNGLLIVSGVGFVLALIISILTKGDPLAIVATIAILYAAITVVITTYAAGLAHIDSEEITRLLTEIRDELKKDRQAK